MTKVGSGLGGGVFGASVVEMVVGTGVVGAGVSASSIGVEVY